MIVREKNAHVTVDIRNTTMLRTDNYFVELHDDIKHCVGESRCFSMGKPEMKNGGFKVRLMWTNAKRKKGKSLYK